MGCKTGRFFVGENGFFSFRYQKENSRVLCRFLLMLHCLFLWCAFKKNFASRKEKEFVTCHNHQHQDNNNNEDVQSCFPSEVASFV